MLKPWHGPVQLKLHHKKTKSYHSAIWNDTVSQTCRRQISNKCTTVYIREWQESIHKKLTQNIRLHASLLNDCKHRNSAVRFVQLKPHFVLWRSAIICRNDLITCRSRGRLTGGFVCIIIKLFFMNKKNYQTIWRSQSQWCRIWRNQNYQC